jgi:glycosyltransferase involved in cell wall biosynthesis
LTPLISIITATRNAASRVSALYESLASQSFPDFEWIVSDGLSSDGTLELLQQFQQRSPWVQFCSEADFGIYDAINKALVRARGRYYLVAGADDVLHERALASYAELAELDNADVVMARVLRGSRVVGGFFPRRAWIGPSKAFASCHSVGTLLRLDLHRRFGMYSARFPLLADVHFLKVLLRSGQVRFIDARFVAGSFADTGVSSMSGVQALAENWQIQVLTERFPLLQTVLFIGKIIVRSPRMMREQRAGRTAGGT